MRCKVFYILLLVWCVLYSPAAYTQNDSLKTSEDTWTNEQWQRAKEGVEYSKPPEKEKKKKNNQEPQKKIEQKKSESKISDWLSGVFGSGLFRVIIISAIILLLIVTLYYLIRKSKNAAAVKLKEPDLITIDNLEEHIEETDLERFLRLSLQAGDYKSAVRVLYLMSIQKLHHSGSIRWKKDKTNRDYLYELRKTEYYAPFSEVTLVYEVVWYGDLGIEQQTFNRIRPVFDGFIKSIILAEKAS